MTKHVVISEHAMAGTSLDTVADAHQLRSWMQDSRNGINFGDDEERTEVVNLVANKRKADLNFPTDPIDMAIVRYYFVKHLSIPETSRLIGLSTSAIFSRIK